MEKITFTEKWLAYIENKDYVTLRMELSEENPVDIADFFSELNPHQTVIVFRTLPKNVAAEVFTNLSSDTKQGILEAVSDVEISEIVEGLYVDDAVDMLEELPASMVTKVLKIARAETRMQINQFLKYPENSIGSIMTAEFIDLNKNMTVSDAIRHIRNTGDESESIYTCYVIDDRRVLEGVVTVKELLLSNDEKTIDGLMNDMVISGKTTDDREDAVRQMMKYDFISLPIVDGENRLVGIVTVDDVMDVMQAETTEDFEKMAAMQPLEKPYLKTSTFSLAKNRIIWLLLLMVSGMITGQILGKYEAAFAALPILVTFIPMLTDTGGNAGSQSSTLIIRGMAVGEIDYKDFFRVLRKELTVSLEVGLTLGLVNFVRLIITYPGQTMLALTVSLALLLTVIMAKTIGGILPIFAKYIKVDPAIMAAPLITTIVDAFSLIIYFNMAVYFLKL